MISKPRKIKYRPIIKLSENSSIRVIVILSHVKPVKKEITGMRRSCLWTKARELEILSFTFARMDIISIPEKVWV
jgi:hypothetical protein